MPGKGDFLLTGQLGDVMKESAQTGISYIRSVAPNYHIDAEFFKEHDIPVSYTHLVMIEKMYGAGIFFEDAANALIQAEYPKAADESGLEIVSQPEIDVVQIEKGKSFIFTAEVAVKPEVTLGEYKGDVYKRQR